MWYSPNAYKKTYRIYVYKYCTTFDEKIPGFSNNRHNRKSKQVQVFFRMVFLIGRYDRFFYDPYAVDAQICLKRYWKHVTRMCILCLSNIYEISIFLTPMYIILKNVRRSLADCFYYCCNSVLFKKHSVLPSIFILSKVNDRYPWFAVTVTVELAAAIHIFGVWSDFQNAYNCIGSWWQVVFKIKTYIYAARAEPITG